MDTQTTLEVRPLTGSCGAEIFGVDLSRTLSADTVKAIRQALLDHNVIFFREQALTPEQHRAFTRQFGEVVVNPVYTHVEGYPDIMPVIKEPNDRYNIGDTWHSDMSYMQEPPLGSVLYGRDIPEYGGDTLFANMYLAYELLPDALKQMIDGRRAYHSDRYLTSRISERNAGRSTRLKADADAQENLALHPMVRTHEETGRKCLYVNFPFTWQIEGLSREESLPLLNQLYAHAARPELACRFRWRKGSLAFWDNRCTMHYACNDYQGKRREMHRMTIAGGRPQ
ncbi:taurine catabolism dioxygenase, TauD/TfdA family [Bordetella bronchiseptica 99-R-0433]|uniref:TauD/TfdA dioxygenase family protein n=1 Tax=Bordetella bronchiseptica TaxID=518 RepID=UPI000459977B|nr:TauD/TfdA family dioxygenase [Bordetella bronchiseptica]KCV61173.1 taurine catabolism dioxygenase, TauD/TfdA family [Bordetella bronchiseptica 99-R-0433]